MKHFLIFALALTTFFPQAIADEDASHDHAEKHVEQPEGTEVHQGHQHHQAHIQILQTSTTLLFEIDFPADDIKDRSHQNINMIRNPQKIFTLHDWNPTCELTQSTFKKKDLGSTSHADYLLSFEYTCTKPLKIESIDLNPFFDLPIDIEMAKTHFIIGDQVLPPVEIRKKNALIKLKKTQ